MPDSAPPTDNPPPAGSTSGRTETGDDLLFECLAEYERRAGEQPPPRPEDFRRRLGENYARFLDLIQIEGMLKRSIEPESTIDLPTLLPERYSGFRPVGEGGMGLVYWAVDNTLNREVAFKVVKPREHAASGDTVAGPMELASPPTGTPASRAFGVLRQRFLQEAWVTSGMTHAGIVPVYELGETANGVPYYTMRFVRGERTFAAEIDAVRGHDVEDRLPLLEPFLKVCDTVGYAHAHGVVHRDLKPQNIALGEFGEVVVLDWGLAKLDAQQDLTEAVWKERLQEYRSASNFMTVTSALGTPGYMAPEAAKGDVDSVDEQSDVYSLGVILFELLTGELPFRFSNWGEFAMKLLQQDPARADEVVHAVPAPLADLCERALRRDRGARLASVADLARGVREWQSQSASQREVLRLLDEANAYLATAEDLEGVALLGQLDRAAGDVRRVLEIQADQSEALALTERIETLRQRGIEERAQRARRRLLRIGGGIAVGVVALLAVLITKWQGASDLAREREWYSLRDQARAARWSRKVGRRGDSLAALKRAAAIRRDPSLRQEALACLALCDLSERAAWPEVGAGLLGADADLKRCVWSPHSAKGDMLVRDMASGEELARIPGNGYERHWTVLFHPQGRHVAWKDGKTQRLHVWDLDASKVVFTSATGFAEGAMAFHPEGTQLALGQADGTITTYTFPEGRKVAEAGLGMRPRVMAFAPDGTKLAVVSFKQEQVVILQGLPDGPLEDTWRVPIPAPRGVAWSPDGQSIAVASGDLNIHVYRIDRSWRYGAWRTLRGHEAPPTELLFTPDGSLLLSSGWDTTLRVWDVPSGENRLTLRTDSRRLQMSADGTRVAFGATAGVQVWDLIRSRAWRRIPSREYDATGFGLSGDGQHLAVVETRLDGRPTIQLWDVRSPRWLARLQSKSQSNLFSALFVDDKRLLVSGHTGLHWCEVDTTQDPVVLRDIPGPTAGVGGGAEPMARSGDGGTLAVAVPGAGRATVWPVDGSWSPKRLAHPGVTQVALSHDGTAAATAAWRGQWVGIWDVRTETLTKRIDCTSVAKAAFGNKGLILVVSDLTGLRAYDRQSWELLAQHEMSAKSFLAAHPSQDLLAVAEASGTIVLRRPGTLEELGRLEPQDTGGPNAVQFSRDGRYVAVCRGALGVELWDLDVVRERLASMGLDWQD